MFSPLAQGMLLDKFDPDQPPKFGEGDVRSGNDRFNPEYLRRLRKKLDPIKGRFGSSVQDLAPVALQYALSRSAHSCVIPGFKSGAQVEINVGATGKPLSQDEVDFVRRQLQS